jgi:hypothetical protein
VPQLVKSLTGLELGGVVPKAHATLQRQIDARVAAGTLRPIAAEQFFVNLVSLCVFPFAARPLICAALQLDARGFQRLVEQRKTALPQFFLDALRP